MRFGVSDDVHEDPVVSHVRRGDDDHVARLALEELLVVREDVEIIPVERFGEFDGEETRGRVGIGDGDDGEVLVVAEVVEVDEVFSSHHADPYDSVLGDRWVRHY